MTSTVVAIVVLVAESALIAGLLVQSIRRRKAEGARLETEARSSAILRAVPDLMFVIAPDGTYLDYYARDAADLYAPPEQFLGRKIGDLMPPELAETFMDALGRTQRT